MPDTNVMSRRFLRTVRSVGARPLNDWRPKHLKYWRGEVISRFRKVINAAFSYRKMSSKFRLEKRRIKAKFSNFPVWIFVSSIFNDISDGDVTHMATPKKGGKFESHFLFARQ
jgi:hypothetical protein